MLNCLNVNLSVHHDDKTVVQLHVSLMSALDGGEQLWTPVTLLPGKGRCSHFTGGWGCVGSRAGVDFMEKRKVSGTYRQSGQITRPPHRGFLCQVRAPPGSTLLNCALCLDTVSYIPPLFPFTTLTDCTSEEDAGNTAHRLDALCAQSA